MREKPFAAVGAEVRSLPRVRQLVPRQRSFVDKTSVTLRAFEDVLPRVAALVLLHVSLSFETFSTMGARERRFLRVNLHVSEQTAFVKESFSALETDVRPFLLVSSPMSRQRRLTRETFPTVTRVRSLLVVLLDMAVQGVGGIERLLATRTRKAAGSPFGTVHPHVSDKRGPPSVVFATSAAEEHAFSHVCTGNVVSAIL